MFPEELSGTHRVSAEGWLKWDEPYKIGYREYVHNQVTKDTTTYSLKNAIGRSKLFDQLDPGWKSVIVAHYGAITMPEYLASIGEARIGRFGRSAAWRNTATFGTLDEVRHGQIQAFFPFGLLDKEPRGDWALKAFHTNNWIVLAVRYMFDDMFVANDALSIALQLTFTLETGFTNLQFLGMAADAIDVGDLEFGALISSIQTDEARHAQQGEPTIKVLIDNGEAEWGQFLIDHMFWRSWRIFALLTGLSMDYYTPLENRRMSFKEFIEDWVVKPFADQFRDYGLEFPWYWDEFINELTWYHHAIHLGVWYYRPTVWWNPDAGVSAAERLWLEEKYPGWNRDFGKHWDVITENVRNGDVAAKLRDAPDHLQSVPVAGGARRGRNRRRAHRSRAADICAQRAQVPVLLGAVPVDLRPAPGPVRRPPVADRPGALRGDQPPGSRGRAAVLRALGRGAGPGCRQLYVGTERIDQRSEGLGPWRCFH